MQICNAHGVYRQKIQYMLPKKKHGFKRKRFMRIAQLYVYMPPQQQQATHCQGALMTKAPCNQRGNRRLGGTRAYVYLIYIKLFNVIRLT